METESAGPEDRETVARQLGRKPHPFSVAARCPYGLPAVIENEPARSMPTRFWVTCPYLAARIAGLEAAGGVRSAQEELGEEVVEAVHAEHQRRYGNRVAGIRDDGYIKCLHAFAALQLAGAIHNLVAEWALERLEAPYPESCCTASPE